MHVLGIGGPQGIAEPRNSKERRCLDMLVETDLNFVPGLGLQCDFAGFAGGRLRSVAENHQNLQIAEMQMLMASPAGRDCPAVVVKVAAG